MSPPINVFLLTKLLRYISLLLLFILASSAWGLSELWGGGIPTSDINQSALRLLRLLLLFNLALLPHLFLILFSVLLFTPSLLPPPHLYPLLFQPLCILNRSPTPLLLRSANHLSVAHCPTPIILHCLSLCPAPHAYICCRSSGGALSLCLLRPALMPLLTPRGFTCSGASASLCTYLVLLKFSSESCHHPVLVSLLDGFFAKRQEAKAPTLIGSRAPWYSPSSTWPCQFRSGNPNPLPPPYPSSSPPCCHYPISVGRRSVGLISITWCNPRM